MVDPTLRQARLAQNPQFGPSRLARLHEATIALFGVGNVGGQLAAYLARYGIRLVVIDRGRVSAENFATQVYADGIGRPKVRALEEMLVGRDPDCRIRPVFADLSHLGRGFLHGVDLVISCLDSWADRVRLRDIMLHAKVPLMDLAVDGPARRALVRCAVYGAPSLDAACLCCSLDTRALEEIRREGQGNSCSKWGAVGRTTGPAPTLATAATGGLVAALGAIIAPRILLGEGGDWLGREVLLDVDGLTLRTHRLDPNPRCLFSHTPYSPAMAGRRELLSVGATFAAAAEHLGGPAASLHLLGRSLVAELSCGDCQGVYRPFRLLDALGPADISCPCGGSRRPSAIGLWDQFDAAAAAPFLKSTWSSLGLPPQDVIVAARGEQTVALLIV